ncbi:MAG TPA: Stp1/IreP family PP2C-type Ser/Thr phosphatase [Gaiellaceae bacterium]|nr:Stp1/IreP family PP2C-type Ser/Thr phosphatase [Gaiellaceae bacterium]
MRISQYSAESNVGRKRRHNEDSYVELPPIFAVADGMGGAQAGEVASGLAAETVRELDHDPNASGEERVVALIKAANLRVHERAASDAAASGMGTTMTVAILQADGSVAIGHVGDSRAYRLRGGQLEQLTNDHSLVAELVRRGELSPAEAAVHPQRSVITRALGTEADVDVDSFTVEAEDGDVFLLCSDGLTTMVPVDTIEAILEKNRSRLEAAAAALIKAANDRGGDDNITAILFAVADGEPGTADELPPAAPAHDPDDEDTLHPEDDVHLPPELLDAPPAEVTMVVSADELARALAANAPTEPMPEAPVPDVPEAQPAESDWPVTQLAPAVPPPAAESDVEAPAAPADPDGMADTARADTTMADAVPRTAQPEPGPRRTSWLESPGAAVDPGTALSAPAEAASAEPEGEPEQHASVARLALAALVIAALVAAIVLLVLEALPR